MTLTLGWYIHHHGRGHLTRLLALAPQLHARIRCFSSLPRPDDLPVNCSWTVLDRDDDAREGVSPDQADPTVGGLLHWAPLGHPGHRRRLGTIAAALRDEPVDAFVVDVSVEVTLFVRLLGVPTVVVAQPGRRDDEPHRLAYAAATTIVAPWPQALLRPAHLEAVRDKTVFTGGISRFESRARVTDGSAGGVVLLGGAAITASDIAAAEDATGEAWHALGGDAWTADPWPTLTSARVVVTWAGQNAVADVAAAGAAAVVVPQERPFGEQRQTAQVLDRAGLAVVRGTWPDAAEWADLLGAAEALRADWDPWEVDGAARRAADAIASTARGER